MGLQDSLLGSPGQTQIHQAAGTKPPGFNFARDFFSQLMGIANNNPYPTYQGQLDPGLSPTLQNLLRGAQGYQQSSMPEILAGVQGSLGGMMSPQYLNPQWRLQGGYNAPFSSSFDPSTKIFNGNPMSSYFGLKGGGSPFPAGGGQGPQNMNGGGLMGGPSGQGGGGQQMPQFQMPPSMMGGAPPGGMAGVGLDIPPTPGAGSPFPPSYGPDQMLGGAPRSPQDTTFTSTATPMPKQTWPPGWR